MIVVSLWGWLVWFLGTLQGAPVDGAEATGEAGRTRPARVTPVEPRPGAARPAAAEPGENGLPSSGPGDRVAGEAEPIDGGGSSALDGSSALELRGQPPWRAPPEVLAWVRGHWKGSGSPRQRLRRLHALLVLPGGWGLVERPGASRGATGVARARQADCVGFAMLYAGLARELGLAVRFVVEERGTIDRRAGPSGRLRVREAHLAVALDDGRADWLVDFAGVRRRADTFRTLDDRGATAILWSNWGARSLLGGRCEPALGWARRAALEAPGLASAHSNLATVEKLCGFGAASRSMRAGTEAAVGSGVVPAARPGVRPSVPPSSSELPW